ncbi:PREDICTED: mediator of RNA polymerase II transcription subunit 7a-like isoform X2 [Nelumbo nucifera]|uniref:Mediator of RNA polymerase II transcription subunit 7 n=1 Tax=Nelumbo nucifera TaxID=4432 RepID=A0A1U8B9I8_NELNU|nr:PREDICTED: mediator of RNA polymerase II transcription subunit 7a-like isoform X2 [Nelumbo nucifera]
MDSQVKLAIVVKVMGRTGSRGQVTQGKYEVMAATSATYPPPPPYYRLYKDYLQNPKLASEPPPPIQGTYMLYGGTYTTDDVLPSLEEQGVRQLYPKGPNIDFKKELRSLNRELQLHILELADVLVERPSQYARRVEDISLIFKNLHHLLNSLRPHQARATLIHILELQIQRRKQAVEDIRRREEAQRLLKESLGTLDGH